MKKGKKAAVLIIVLTIIFVGAFSALGATFEEMVRYYDEGTEYYDNFDFPAALENW